jgi:DNA polymerase III subunit epsilon
MRVLGIDLETTGLDTSKDRITEIGVVVWDVGDKKPLTIYGSLLHDDSYPKVSKEVTEVTGITDAMCKEFGKKPVPKFEWLDRLVVSHNIEYVVAHNGENFDKPLLLAEFDRNNVAAENFRKLKWLDTRYDIPFPSEPDSRKLKYMAADHGFLNPFSHRAVFDVLTMLTVLAHYDIRDVIAYNNIPWIYVEADVTFHTRQLAKDQRFSWERIGTGFFPKKWVKKIKANELESLQQHCGFKVVEII